MTYERGSFVLCLYPNSDLKTYKKRPALVVQDTTLDTGFPQVIVALVTSSPAVLPAVTRVPVEVASRLGKRTGLIRDSVIVLDNLATIETQVIERKLGSCGNYGVIEKAIKAVFGIDRGSA